MEVENYKLRANLIGHSMDVRGVAVGATEDGKEFIVSSSRDKTSKLWFPSGDGNFEMHQTCEGHTNFVSCVCVLPPSERHPSGLILTGGNDHTILAFEIGKHSPSYRLASHKGTVCSIAAVNEPELLVVSGSWDMTAKVWRGQQNIATLVGHAQAVWAVATIPGSSGRILTGSADREIFLWDKAGIRRKFQGHMDCVRALAVLDDNRFISGSNDATIRMWDMTTADNIHTFYGHTNFIYSLTILPTVEGFASVGEDRTLRIWKSDDCAQVIFLPAMSVWTVAAMMNGDIVTGSSDGIVRVFTRETEKMAPPEVQNEFEESVAQMRIATELELGGLKVSKLPGLEALLQSGKKDGETMMVRENSQVVCYSWTQAEGRWTKIGDVVGGSGATQSTSGRVLFDGKEYDYVFNVELDSKTKLKLPFNITEDPWFAAQKFVENNDLDQIYLDQVANFIINNTKGIQLGTTRSEYTDPFTGGNRYVPDGSELGAVGGVDPFTGAGAYRTASSDPSTPMDLGIPEFPILEFIKFPLPAKGDALKTKLTQFVKEMGPTFSLDERCVPEILRLATSGTDWDDKLETSLTICLKSFPQDRVFPILDLLRTAVLDPSVGKIACERLNIFEELVPTYLAQHIVANQMLILRLLCNFFGTETETLMKDRSAIISSLLSNLQKGKPNQVAAATLVFNYSIVVSGIASRAEGNELNEDWCDTETQTEVLMAVISMIEFLDDPEALYRLLVAVGNLIFENSLASNLFVSLGGVSTVKNFAKSGLLPKIKSCAAQILAKLNECF